MQAAANQSLAVKLAVRKVAISLRRDVARPNRFPMKSRLITAGSWQIDLFDTNKSDGSPPGRAFVTAERDGYLLFPPANRTVHPCLANDLPSLIGVRAASIIQPYEFGPM